MNIFNTEGSYYPRFLLKAGLTVLALGNSLSHALPMLGKACSNFETNYQQVYVDPSDGSLVKKSVPLPNSSGVLYDSDCRTMYVLPPKVGVFTLSGLARIDAMELCPMRSQLHQEMFDRNERMREIEEKIISLSPDDPQAAGKREFYLGQLAFQIEFQDQDKEELASTSIHPGYTSSVELQVEWDALVNQYEALNPGLSVIATPLRASFLTASVKQQDALGNVVVGGSHYEPLRSVSIPGIASAPEAFDWIEGSGGSAPVVIDGSFGAQIVLNLPGACPFEEVLDAARLDGRSLNIADLNKEAVKLAMRPYLVANLTYFYPVHTDTNFKIEVDIDSLVDVFQSITNENNTQVNVKSVVNRINELTHKNVINVTWEAGAGSATNKSIVDIADLKDRVASAVISDILNQFGTPTEALEPIEDVPSPDDPHYVQKMSRYVCHSKSYIWGLKKKTHCHSETYDLKVPTTGWGQSMKEFFQMANITHEENWKVSNTVFQVGTLTFSK
ncbi:hypothetical protein GW915_09690 [bacterium]|nr:hypothetical protein [bacterium]